MSTVSSTSFFCNSCKCNKMHKLPFSVSTLSSSKPLELLYTDVWGASPGVSIDGYKYYFIFVDHLTKYIWFFSMTNKSDVPIIFPKFKATVEKFFQKSIISLYRDNGGEFIHLRFFFGSHGFSHFLTPHPPEHNAHAERRYRYIVKMVYLCLI